MQYQVYYEAIKEILDLVTIIQDQDLGKEMQLELMSQNLLVQIDQMVKYAKQLVSINQSKQQIQELNLQKEEKFSQELAQEQLFLQKDQQQDQQKQQQQEQYEQDQQQQLINIEQNLYIQQEQNLQSNQQEYQDQYDQEIQQQQNVQKQLSLKQQLQLQNQKQQQQKQQQQKQQQQQQQQEQQQQQQQQKQYQNLYEHKIQGSSVIFYPIKQPQYQNQNRQEVTLNDYNDKLKIKYNKLLKLTNGEIIDEKQYPQFNKTHMHEQCPICISDIFDLADQQDIIQLPCNHLFHCDCINQCINNDSLKCPIDQKIYGIIIGDQPDGTMISQCIPNKCEGYSCDTISIEYFFESGIKNGQPYTGTHRQAYLPNNPEGKEALELLKICFNQKLTFTIGTSLTTGQQHQVVWNGIHHKTSLSGGPTRFGYPDNTYFQRLKQELSAKGIN